MDGCVNLSETKSKQNGYIEKRKPQTGEMSTNLYESRESLLTEMFKGKDAMAVYEIFVTILICICLNAILYDYFHNEGIRSGYVFIVKAFRNFHLLIVPWICMVLITMCVCPSVNYWAKTRYGLGPNSSSVRIWDKLCITVFGVYVLTMVYFPISVSYKYNLGYATCITAASEATRLLMKAYAFVRSNAARNFSVGYPSFSQYLYFLFAPTLVYKDSYPRSRRDIRWRLVGMYLIEMTAIIFVYSIIYERTYMSQLKDYGAKPYGWDDIIMIIFNNTLCALLITFLSFYLILHLWLNIFAEILQFSDKRFYEDWWTSSSYARYYRTWNCVVQEWLHTYVYKDFYEVICPGNRFIAKQAVFFISALFHEYITSVANGFCLPTFMLLFFGLGNYLSTVNIPNAFIGNIFLLHSLALGSSTMFVVNNMEHFCRLNRENDELSMSSFFTPIFYKCMFNSTN